MSFDSAEENKAFSEKFSFNFPLLCDTDRKMGLAYGAAVAIHTPQAASIKWVHLIRPMAVTHSNDCSQRLVDVPIEHHDTCHLHVHVPDNPNLAPPGWYMLYICDTNGVPSNAEWVHLGSPAAPDHHEPDHHEPDHPDHDHQPGEHHSHVPGFPIPGFDPPPKP